jgi:hypothetical protein
MSGLMNIMNWKQGLSAFLGRKEEMESILTPAEQIDSFKKIVDRILIERRLAKGQGHYHELYRQSAEIFPRGEWTPIGDSGNLFMLDVDNVVALNTSDPAGAVIDAENPFTMARKAMLFYLQPDDAGLKVGLIALGALGRVLGCDNFERAVLMRSSFVRIDAGNLIRGELQGIMPHVGSEAGVHRDRWAGEPDIIFASRWNMTSAEYFGTRSSSRFRDSLPMGIGSPLLQQLSDLIPSWRHSMSFADWKALDRSMEPELQTAMEKFGGVIEKGFQLADADETKRRPAVPMPKQLTAKTALT